MVSGFHRAKNVIKVFYPGKGIHVVDHDKEKMYVPSLLFCHSLTSFNCNDQEETVTGGCNCFGAKLCNIFSRSFELKTGSKVECKSFKQTWTDNMTNAGNPRDFTLF
jgi:DNA topoisomerase-2